MTTDSVLRAVLEQAKTIAVVGLSDKPDRDSYRVAAYLQRAGYRIVPVNPALDAPVLDEQPYATLEDIPFAVDIVDVFRRADAVPAIVASAIGIGASYLWLQLGIVHPEATARAEAAGIGVVADRCMKIEHARLLPST